MRELTAHDTHHTLDESWPLALGINALGQSIHVCADCGAELTDGCCADRDEEGHVVAWLPGGIGDDGQPVKTIIHQCAGKVVPDG